MAQQYFRLEAPYPAVASTLLLPQPEIGNNQGLNSLVNVIKMMDGSRRSYIQKGENKRSHRWTFTLSSEKAFEFADFVKRYRGATFRVNWRDVTITGKLDLNPLDVGGVGREYYSVTMGLIEV
ncbi:MAG: hypothetical protein GY906_04700 [bacterium]|nr:hypothetical protein [bacterium]